MSSLAIQPIDKIKAQVAIIVRTQQDEVMTMYLYSAYSIKTSTDNLVTSERPP